MYKIFGTSWKVVLNFQPEIFTSPKPYSNFDACQVSFNRGGEFSKGCAIGMRKSWSKIFIGDFRLPFVQAVGQLVFPCKW